MSRLTYDTIATLDGPAPGTSPSRRRITAPFRLGRRGLLKGAAAGGVGLAMTLFERAPFVREAEAACTTTLETSIRAGCPSAVSGTCSPACGPSTVYNDACTSSGWHKTTGNFRMRPNQCGGSPYDGWYWYAAGCGCPSGFGRNYRCHDGCRRNSSTSAWVNSICRSTGACLG
jgi:hypothetical protein